MGITCIVDKAGKHIIKHLSCICQTEIFRAAAASSLIWILIFLPTKSCSPPPLSNRKGLWTIFSILDGAMRPESYPHSTNKAEQVILPSRAPLIPLIKGVCLAVLVGIRWRSGRSEHVQTQCPTKVFPSDAPPVRGNCCSNSKWVPFIASREVLLLIWQV